VQSDLCTRPQLGEHAVIAAYCMACAGGGRRASANSGRTFGSCVPNQAAYLSMGPQVRSAGHRSHTFRRSLQQDRTAGVQESRAFQNGSHVAQTRSSSLDAARKGQPIRPSAEACCVYGVRPQAAYAAYSAIATQAATVVGAMDKVWSGGGGPEGSGHGAADSQSGSASAQQQQARLAVALASREDGDDVYVQVSSCACIARCQAAR
jgi:hypothetical protein